MFCTSVYSIQRCNFKIGFNATAYASKHGSARDQQIDTETPFIAYVMVMVMHSELYKYQF